MEIMGNTFKVLSHGSHMVICIDGTMRNEMSSSRKATELRMYCHSLAVNNQNTEMRRAKA